MALVWDIETDNFLDKLTKIHCIATLDTETMVSNIYGPDEVEDGIGSLMAADEIIGHNIITFDIPAIKKLYSWFSTDGLLVTDTLVLSRLICSDQKNDDYMQGYHKSNSPKSFMAHTA